MVAGNGYLGGLVPEVAARVMPINNFIVATAPLGEARARALIRDDVAVADSRFVVNYFRLSADRRLLFGGGESYGWRFPADIAGVVRPRMLAVFPELADVAIEHAWGGTLAITVNRMPAFQRLGPGVFSAGGYSGHGVALATLAGKLMAEAVQGTAGRFDVFAVAAAAALSRRGGAALAAPGAGDELVRAAGPALDAALGRHLAGRGLPAEPADGAAEGADAAGGGGRRDLCAVPLRGALGGAAGGGAGAARGGALPAPTAAFAAWGLVGAVAQIGATLLLLHLFSLRNFAVGNTFAKTETVQAVLFGFLLLGDRVGALALAGILVSLVGLVMLSATRGLGGGALNRAAAIGLACGAAFAVAGIGYRAASLALADPGGLLIRPAFTLAYVTLVQSVLLTGWLWLRGGGGVGAVLREWRIEAMVGAAGMLASLGWFTAFTLVTVAQVKAVGQVELVFSLADGALCLRRAAERAGDGGDRAGGGGDPAGDPGVASEAAGSKVYGVLFDAHIMHNACTTHMLRKTVGIEIVNAADPVRRHVEERPSRR